MGSKLIPLARLLAIAFPVSVLHDLGIDHDIDGAPAMFLPLGDDVETRTLPLVGGILVALNVLCFTLEVRVSQQPTRQRSIIETEKMFRTWGLVPLDLRKDRYVGLISHQFVHANFSHLLGNMLVLWAFVRTLEHGLGGFTLLGFYLFWGVVAGLAHCLAVPDSKIPLVGASGAISGLIGAYFAAFGFRTRILTLIWIIVPRRIHIPSSLYVITWLFSQFMGVAAQKEGEATNVAWWAHLGGFAIGAITMGLCRGSMMRRIRYTADGRLSMVETEKETEAPDPAEVLEEAAEPSTMPAVHTEANCPFCNAIITQEHRVSRELILCPNPDCKRLIYLT